MAQPIKIKVKPKDIIPPPVGRITAASTSFSSARRNPNVPTTISGYKSRNMDLLCSLRRTLDVYSAIELITEQHPDAAMAVQSYVRLANNGHQMEIFVDGKKNDYVESVWNELAAQPIDSNTKGFDGLIDQAHDGQFRFGGLGVECAVSRKAKSLEGIYPILPQWITWRQDTQGHWHAFQQQGTKEVELSAGNFFWIALDNNVGQPTGKLQLEPALMAIERHLEFVEDSAATLRHSGHPRNDIAIDRESFVKSLPAHIRNDPKKLSEALAEYFNFIRGLMRQLEPKDDIIHFNDIVVNKSQGQNSRTVDLRSYNEVYDPQVMNGLGAMSILLNRTTGITETWGTVQFKILIQNIQNAQRGSKRLAENICKLWLRVNGIQGTCKFTHNPVDWESEIKRLEAALLKQTLHHNAEDYEWQDKETAAKDGMNITKLPKPKPKPKQDGGNIEDSEETE